MGEFHLDGFATITNLHVNHPKIANKDVVIKKRVLTTVFFWALILFLLIKAQHCNSIK